MTCFLIVICFCIHCSNDRVFRKRRTKLNLIEEGLFFLLLPNEQILINTDMLIF